LRLGRSGQQKQGVRSFHHCYVRGPGAVHIEPRTLGIRLYPLVVAMAIWVYAIHRRGKPGTENRGRRKTGDDGKPGRRKTGTTENRATENRGPENRDRKTGTGKPGTENRGRRKTGDDEKPGRRKTGDEKPGTDGTVPIFSAQCGNGVGSRSRWGRLSSLPLWSIPPCERLAHRKWDVRRSPQAIPRKMELSLLPSCGKWGQSRLSPVSVPGFPVLSPVSPSFVAPQGCSSGALHPSVPGLFGQFAT
jgi:hypothetical protein